jgi:ABC-type uncharacterized transport system permease subunit
LDSHFRIVEVIAVSVFTVIMYCVVSRLLDTPFGLAIRSVGQRPSILTVSGYNSKLFLIIGLAFANAIVAIAGWLEAVTSRNISLKNFGIVINVLAAVLLGDFIRHMVFAILPRKWRHATNWLRFMLLSPLAGALVYSMIRSFVIKVLTGQFVITITTDLQFIIALCIILSIFAGKMLGTSVQSEDTSS